MKSNKIIFSLLFIIIIILLTLVVLMITGTISFNSNINENSFSSNIVKQKSTVNETQILSYYKEMISDLSNNLYSVVDINNDGIPELFVYTTGTIGNELVAYTSVFTYDENKGDRLNNYIVSAGYLSGRIDNNTVLYKMNNGSLLSVFGHMGYEITSYFKLENDWLVRTDFSSRQTNTYISGDIQIQFKPVSDTSLIDNF